MSAFDAYFGRVQSEGVDQEIQGAINFQGFTVTPDPANGRVNVAVPTEATRNTSVMVVVDGASWEWSYTAHDTAIRGYDHIVFDWTSFEGYGSISLYHDGAVENDEISLQIWSQDYTVTIADDDTGGAGVIVEVPTDSRMTYDFRFIEGAWVLWRASTLPAPYAPPT